MADRIITDERLREIATADPLALAICASLGLPACCGSLADAAKQLTDERDAARADLREALALLRAYGQPHYWVGLKDAIDWNTRWGKLLAKHKETP